MQVSFCANSLDHVTLKDLKIRGRERLRVRDLSLGFLTYSQKIDYPENLYCPFFTRKASTECYLYWRRLCSLPVSKWQNLSYLITCFRHHDFLAKTRSGMTTTIKFSRQNDDGSRVSTNLVVVVVLVLRESKGLSFRTTLRMLIN